MNRLLMIVAAIGMTVPAFAAVDLAQWGWEAPIEVRDAPAGFVRVMLTPEIFDQSQPTLRDLRMLDEAGQVVPHIVRWGRVKEEEVEEWRPARLLNPTFKPEEYSRVTLDFGDQVEKNRLRIELSGENYRRRAMVESGSDGEQWDVLLDDGWLLHVSGPDERIKVDTLDIPNNNFRYLRLTVFNSDDEADRVGIYQVKTALWRIVGEPELAEAPVAAVSLHHDEEKKETVYELDLGYQNLPVSTVKLGTAIADPYFYRGYEILGRNAPIEQVERRTETGSDVVTRDVPWRSVGNGTFYRVRQEDKVSECVVADIAHAPYRYLQVRFSDRDNQPLDIHPDRITVLRREASAVFDCKPEHRYRLIGGNPKAGSPDFDLGRAVEGVAESDLPVLRVGTPTLVPHQPELAPWSERHGVLIWLALIAAVVAMLVLILSNLGRLRDVSRSDDTE
jgi:hypothetical protein